jgi:fluoride exporter
MTLLLVALGAAIGAPARYLTDRAVSTKWRTVFPYGTLTVNVAGSLILGLLIGGADHHGVSTSVAALVGTGFCGALTTYSTFGYETMRLMHDRLYSLAFRNMLVSLAAGCAAAYTGLVAAGQIWS